MEKRRERSWGERWPDFGGGGAGMGLPEAGGVGLGDGVWLLEKMREVKLKRVRERK